MPRRTLKANGNSTKPRSKASIERERLYSKLLTACEDIKQFLKVEAEVAGELPSDLSQRVRADLETLGPMLLGQYIRSEPETFVVQDNGKVMLRKNYKAPVAHLVKQDTPPPDQT